MAALWSDGEGRPVLDAALDVFLTRPRHTSRKEFSISFDEVQHKKKERSYVNMVTLVLQVLHSLCSGKDMMVRTPIDAKEQPDMAAHTETIVCDVTTVQQTVVGANLANAVASTDDLHLIEQLRSGNEEAFVSLINRYYTAMLRLAMVYVTARAVAEEVVQETWVGVLQGLGRFEGRASLKTWMFRILTNRAKTRALREGRSIPFSSLPELDTDHPEPAVDPKRFLPADYQWSGHWISFPLDWRKMPEERLLSREMRAYLEKAIEALPASQRTIITLRDIEGWTPDEACSFLGISEANQRVLLHRARSKVRGVLEKYFAEE